MDLSHTARIAALAAAAAMNSEAHNIDQEIPFSQTEPLQRQVKKFSEEESRQIVDALDKENIAALYKIVGNSIDRRQALLQMKLEGDEEGNSLLHAAATASRSKSVDYLLRIGANPNAKNANGDTPLHRACKVHGSGNTDEHVVESLLRSGANVNEQDGLGQTPLYIIASRAQSHQDMNGAAVASSLLKHGASTNILPASGKSYGHFLEVLYEDYKQYDALIKPFEEAYKRVKNLNKELGIHLEEKRTKIEAVTGGLPEEVWDIGKQDEVNKINSDFMRKAEPIYEKLNDDISVISKGPPYIVEQYRKELNNKKKLADILKDAIREENSPQHEIKDQNAGAIPQQSVPKSPARHIPESIGANDALCAKINHDLATMASRNPPITGGAPQTPHVKTPSSEIKMG